MNKVNNISAIKQIGRNENSYLSLPITKKTINNPLIFKVIVGAAYLTTITLGAG